MFGQATRLIFQPRFAAWRLFAGAAMISFSGVFVKLVSVSPTSSAFWRVVFGGVFLVAWVLARRHRLLPGRAVGLMLLLAAVFFALDLGFWHRSIVYLGPGLATLLGNFQVFFMALAGALVFREHLGPRLVVAIPLAVLGLALIVGFDFGALPREARLGVVFGLLTAVVYAGYMVFMRLAQARGEGREISADLAVATVLTAALLGVYMLAIGESFAPGSAADATWLVLYGLFAQAIGWVFITSALSHVPAARVGLILLAQPVLAFAWDILFFARQFTPTEALGAAVALIAIYLGSRRGVA